MVAHVYHTCDHVELPDVAAYAYQDVHVQSALRPACTLPFPCPSSGNKSYCWNARVILDHITVLELFTDPPPVTVTVTVTFLAAPDKDNASQGSDSSE